jgi:FHA domain
MTTAVASPPSFQPLSRLGWNSNSGGTGSLNSMSADEVSRMFMPQRKSIQRTNSSSSISSSTSTNSSSSTISASQQPSSNSVTNGESSQWSSKKKPRGGFWPASKAEPVSGVTTARPQISTTASGPNAAAAVAAAHQPSSVVSSQQNGVRNMDPPVQANESLAVLALLPLNGTFERKQINVPFQPGILKVGRQTNAKTVPTPVNGHFDSKVLSRSHAEVWADRNGKIWIRDVKSSNGTFVNGQRLSPENRDSEPHELREHDTLELGIDIVSEDQKSIVHHKVSAKVEFAGIPGTSNNVLDLNFGDIDPSQGGGLLSSSLSQPMAHSRGRPVAPYNRSTASSVAAGSHMSALSQQRQMNMWGMPLGVEHLVKMLSVSQPHSVSAG